MMDTDVQSRKSHTLSHQEELAADLSQAETILRSIGYVGEAAFLELSKILTIKVHEDQRAERGERYRFKTETFSTSGDGESVHPSELLNELFEQAKARFAGIFTREERLRIKDPHVILSLVGVFEGYHLLNLDVDIFGIVYERFFADTFKRESGKFFTPREVVEFMVDMADVRPHDLVFDPTCGSGGFLVGVLLKRPGGARASKSIFDYSGDHVAMYHLGGNEIDPHLTVLTKLNLAMHGNGWKNVFQGNFFTSHAGHLRDLMGNVDVILANPPFSVDITDPNILHDYDLARGKTSQVSDYLFVEQAFRLLKPGGRMVTLLPYSVLGNPSHSSLRKYMRRNWVELATVSLPEGVFKPFGGSSSKASILYLMKPNKNFRRVPILKANAANVGYDHTRKFYRKIPENDLTRLRETDEYAALIDRVREMVPVEA